MKAALCLVALVLGGCAATREVPLPTLDAVNVALEGRTTRIVFADGSSELGATQVHLSREQVRYVDSNRRPQVRPVETVAYVASPQSGPVLRAVGTTVGVGAALAAAGGLWAWRACSRKAEPAGEYGPELDFGCGFGGAALAVLGGGTAVVGGLTTVFVATARAEREILYRGPVGRYG